MLVDDGSDWQPFPDSVGRLGTPADHLRTSSLVVSFWTLSSLPSVLSLLGAGFGTPAPEIGFLPPALGV